MVTFRVNMTGARVRVAPGTGTTEREVTESSPMRNPAPRYTNRVGGGATWASLLKKAKPVTINRVVT